MVAYQTQVKGELDIFLDFSLNEAWRRVKDSESLQTQQEVMQKAYDEYVKCAEFYGISHIEATDPIQLYKSRVSEGIMIP